MNRYLLFCGSTYYPVGGWKDFVGDFASVAEAKAALAERTGFAEAPSYDWWQLVDTAVAITRTTAVVIEEGTAVPLVVFGKGV